MERIKLKNVKYSARFSEETYAFQADIFFDNKKIGYASNRGVGGSTDCNLWNGEAKTKELSEFSEKEAKRLMGLKKSGKPTPLKNHSRPCVSFLRANQALFFQPEKL